MKCVAAHTQSQTHQHASAHLERWTGLRGQHLARWTHAPTLMSRDPEFPMKTQLHFLCHRKMIQTRCACDSPGVAASMASRTKPTMYGSVDWGATKGTSSFTAMTLKNTWTCKCNVLPKPNLPNRNPRNMTCEDNSRSRLVTVWSRVGSGLFPFISIGAFLTGHGWSRVGHGVPG